MAKKSKTQRAKASARRAEKKELNQIAAESPKAVEAPKEEKKSSKLFGGKKKSDAPAKNESKKAAKPAKKEGFFAKRFAFFKEVRSEMRRVTWPSRIDVLRWSGVVVVALIFFSLYVFVLDNWIVTPLLVAISSLGA